jgi:hypothetical protein
VEKEGEGEGMEGRRWREMKVWAVKVGEEGSLPSGCCCPSLPGDGDGLARDLEGEGDMEIFGGGLGRGVWSGLGWKREEDEGLSGPARAGGFFSFLPSTADDAKGELFLGSDACRFREEAGPAEEEEKGDELLLDDGIRSVAALALIGVVCEGRGAVRVLGEEGEGGMAAREESSLWSK